MGAKASRPGVSSNRMAPSRYPAGLRALELIDEVATVAVHLARNKLGPYCDKVEEKAATLRVSAHTLHTSRAHGGLCVCMAHGCA